MRRVPDAYEENVAPGSTPRKQQTRTQTPATVLHPTQQLSQPLAPATILHPTQRVNTPDTELVPTQLAPTQPATPQRDRAARALSFGAATPFVAKNSREGSASTRLSSATPSPTPPAPPPAAEDDLAAALSDRLRFASPGEDVTSPASSSEEEEAGSWLPRAKHFAPESPPSPAAEPLLTPPSPPTPSPRPAQRPPRSLARRLRTLERSGSGAAVGAPPLAKGRIAKAVADLIRRDEEDAGPTLVLAASGPAADEWIAALTLALGPHCDVLKHATTAAALRRNTPARLARMTCVVATYAQASRADPREARTAPASEWLSSARPVAQVQDSVLHRLTWHRAVYDEAHSLLGTSKRARAAETLDANFSWAVFGPVTLDQLSRKPAQLRALAALVKYPRGAPLARLLLERTVRLDD
jgi:hypothetical protein